MTREQIEQLKAAVAKMTPGEWIAETECTNSAEETYVSIIGADGTPLLDTCNSGAMCIESESDEGHTYHVDRVGLDNSRGLVELRNSAADLIADALALPLWQSFAAYCRSCALSGECDPQDFHEFCRIESERT